MKPFVSILAVKAAVFVSKQMRNVDISVFPFFSMRCEQFIQCQYMLLLVIVLWKMWQCGINGKYALHINNGIGAFIMYFLYNFQIVVSYHDIRNIFSNIINSYQDKNF